MGFDTGGRDALRVAGGGAVSAVRVATLAVRIAALAAFLLAACGGPSDRAREMPADSLDFAPRDTVEIGAPVDTAGADSALADTAAWTVGIVDRPSERGVATLVAVRAARHEAFDRIAFEFTGEMPGLHVEYVDRPVRDCGAGEVVPVAGDGWLAVRFYPANAHDEQGRETAPRAVRSALPVVLEIVRTCDFEAVTEYVLGVASPNRYRILELADPHRIVVDVRHGR